MPEATTYAIISAKNITVSARKKRSAGETVCISHDFAGPTVNLPKIKARKVVLAVNLRRIVIRILPDEPENNESLFFTNTHVFDGEIYENDFGEKRYLLAALPAEAADGITKIGVALFGSILRLERVDAIENILFKRFVDEADFIMFPQEEGLRVLHAENKLPKSVGSISSHPKYKYDEYLRVITQKTAGGRAVFLYDEYGDVEKWQWVIERLKNEAGFSVEEMSLFYK